MTKSSSNAMKLMRMRPWGKSKLSRRGDPHSIQRSKDRVEAHIEDNWGGVKYRPEARRGTVRMKDTSENREKLQRESYAEE